MSDGMTITPLLYIVEVTAGQKEIALMVKS